MEIAPRYDGAPIIDIDGAPGDQREVVVRQRRRLLSVLADLDASQWGAASRCDEWSVQDVANHLVTVDGFWSASIAAGLAGAPSRFLVGFDPKATPAALASSMRSQSPDETLAALTAAASSLCDTFESLDDAGWCALAESPPGHVPVRVLAMHALWDCWVHERDVLLPLGIEPVVEPDEVRSSLRYAAGLGVALSVAADPGRGAGALVLEVSDGDRVVVETDGDVVRVGDSAAPAGALVLRGTAVELAEILSVRAPLTVDVRPEQRWLVGGLADVFEVAIS